MQTHTHSDMQIHTVNVSCHIIYCMLHVQTLHRFATLGSDGLDDPSELYSQCVAVHLLPHDLLNGNMESISIEVQRVLVQCRYVVSYSCFLLNHLYYEIM